MSASYTDEIALLREQLKDIVGKISSCQANEIQLMSDIENLEEKQKRTEALLEEKKRMKSTLQKDLDLKIKKRKLLEKQLDALRNEPVNTDNDEFLDFLISSVEEKKKALECPVCLETAQIPIYTCQNFHLVCTVCLPNLHHCPECRGKYSKPVMRHRFAEKLIEEIEKIEQKIKDVLENKAAEAKIIQTGM